MHRPVLVTKALAVVGVACVWFAVLSPLVFGSLAFGAGRRFRVDYLLPAELFPLALLGGGLLLLAAFRVQAWRGLIGGGLGAAAGLLVGGQALAVVTGLASGAVEPAGWRWALVLASLGLYLLALIVVGLGGLLLLRGLFQPTRTGPGRA